MGDGDDDGGGGKGRDDVYNGRAEPMLVSLSDSYSEDEAISISDSRYSSYPAYTAIDYFLSTNYCPKKGVNYVGLRKLFYSKQVF